MKYLTQRLHFGQHNSLKTNICRRKNNLKTKNAALIECETHCVNRGYINVSECLCAELVLAVELRLAKLASLNQFTTSVVNYILSVISYCEP